MEHHEQPTRVARREAPRTVERDRGADLLLVSTSDAVVTFS
jgi:hypothetical protein